MITLNLTIVSYRGESCPPVSRVVESNRFTIGRGASYDWDLPDRTVSRPHCVIEHLPSGYTITDVSSHGVFLNGAAVRIGHGITTTLADGDVIAVGVYDIRVGLHAAPDQPAAPEPVRELEPAAEAASWPDGPTRVGAAPVSARRSLHPVAPAAGAGEVAALRAFLEGAGIGDAVLPAGDEVARLRHYGALFRELVAGLRELLAARAEMKSLLHLPQTGIAGHDNNPFKFSVDVGQAIRALLVPGPSGYSEPLPAIREGVEDVKTHQLAVNAATHEALAALLAMLSPEESQRQADAAGLLGTILPNARKAAWWDAYESAFRRAAEGIEADLSGGFRRTFTEAYADQVQKLRKPPA